jgi:hypothetical protein
VAPACRTPTTSSGSTRGTAYSTPVTCDLTPEERGAVRGLAAGRRGHRGEARAFAGKCGRASTTDLLPHMTTANTARDLDRIREALGEQKISGRRSATARG